MSKRSCTLLLSFVASWFCQLAISGQVIKPSWYPPLVFDQMVFPLSKIALHQPPADTACKTAYEGLYQDETVNVDIYFGYMEKVENPQDTQVLDPYLKQQLIAHLTQRCRPHYFACGFSYQPDLDGYTKQINGPSNTPRDVVIHIYDAAQQPDHRMNTETFRNEQEEKTVAVENSYLSSLHNADVLLYSGHARFGTGPGFAPLPQNLFGWLANVMAYPFTAKINDQLRLSKTPPKLFGLFTCNSEKYFARAFNQYAPDSGLLVATQPTYFSDQNRSLLAVLNSILGLQCAAAFSRSLNDQNQEKAFRLHGFFAPITPQKRNSFVIPAFAINEDVTNAY